MYVLLLHAETKTFFHHVEYETGSFAFLKSNVKSPLLLDLFLPFFKEILLWLLLHPYPDITCFLKGPVQMPL